MDTAGLAGQYVGRCRDAGISAVAQTRFANSLCADIPSSRRGGAMPAGLECELARVGCCRDGGASAVAQTRFANSLCADIPPSRRRGAMPAGLECELARVGCCRAGGTSAVAQTRFANSLYADIPPCLLYTSDAADDLLCVDLGGRRII